MAKRINTPFVVSVGAVLFLGLGVVGFGPSLKNMIYKPNQKKAIQILVENARKYVKEGKLEEAKESITQAYQMDHSNKEVCVERGDIIAQLTEIEGQVVMDQARKCWEDALAVDPTYMPALQRLMDSCIDQMDVAPTAQIVKRLREAAESIVKIEPGNQRAKTYVQIATIEHWVLGTPESDVEINRAIAALTDILKKDPSSGEAMFYIVRAKAYRANDLQRAERRDEASALLADCRNLLAKSAAAFPENANLNFRVFQGYVILMDSIRDPVQNAMDAEGANKALHIAREQVRDTDPRYADYQYVASEWERRNKRPEESEKILREFYRKHESDQRARLALCRALAMTGDSAKREEAIEILRKPIVLIPGGGGVRNPIAKELESQTLLDLATLRVAKYPTVEPAKRPALMKEIEDAYKTIDAMAQPDAIPLLRLQGLIYKVKGDKVKAVESLSRALTLLEHSDPNNPIKYDLMHQLATANQEAGQNRAAEKLLEQIVDHVKDYVPARLELTELLLQENKIDDAAKNIAVLSSLLPANSIDLIKLEISLYARANRPADAQRYYAMLPEKTFPDRLLKAQSSASLQDWNETLRLLTGMQQEKPDDIGIIVAIVHAHVKNNDLDRARQVLAAAAKRFPGETALKMIGQELNQPISSSHPEPRWDVAPSKSGDPFITEIAQGRADLSRNDFAHALGHAHAADALRPNNPATWDLYFYIYAGQKDWTKAANAVENLARLDADGASGNIYRWILAMARDQYVDAIAVGRELTRTRDAFGQSWVLYAKAYQANGQYSEAITNYQAALERQTTNIEAYEGMAECYNALFQPERGQEAIAKARKLFPDNVALRELDLAYQTNADPASIVPIRKSMLDAHPEDPEAYLTYGSVCLRAAQKTFVSDPAQASSFIEQACGALAQGVGKFPADLRLNSALAEILLTARQVDAGAKVLQDLMENKEWKDKPEPLLYLSDYYVRARNIPLAEKALRDAWARTKNKSVEIELHLAQFLSERGRYEDALLLLKANTEDTRIVAQALQIHVAANHTAEAEKGVLAALAKEPHNLDLMNLLVLVYLEGYRYPEARAKADEILAIDPRNDTALYYQALGNMRDPINGDIGVALHNLSAVTLHNTRNVKFKVEYANALLMVRRVDDATVQLADAVHADPYNAEARVRLLDLYQSGKKWQQFETAVRNAELNPATNREAIWPQKHAFALADQGLYSQALAKIRDAISLAPQNPTYARDYLMILLQSHDYDAVMHETSNLLDGVAGAPPRRDWWIYHLRAMAQLEAGKLPEAYEQFEKAMRAADEAKDSDAYLQVIDSIATISPDNAIAKLAPRVNESIAFRIKNVVLHMKKSDWAGSIVALDPLLKIVDTLDRADRITVIRFAAQSFQYGGQPMKAKFYYEKWLKDAPNDTTALNNLACLLAEDLKQPAEARQYSQKAYDFGRRFNVLDSSESDTHGWVLTLCGGQAAIEGLSILSHVVDSSPEFVDARYHLGYAYENLGRKGEAVHNLQVALDQLKAKEEKKLEINKTLKANIEAALDKAKHLPGAA